MNLLSGGGGSESVSPTAHYTGHVWSRNGLSHPELGTIEGRLLFEAVRPSMIAIGAVGGPTLERYLLVRHRALDDLLTEAIEEHGVTQVIEVACGLSPRGWRFTRRYGSGITYVEADLPGMADRKRHALERMGSLGERHRVEEVDALRDRGPGSLAEVASGLDPGQPLAIVTEGLLSYLDLGQLLDLWERFGDVLAGFPAGHYLSDIHLSGDARGPHIQVARRLLSLFVRGPVELHFEHVPEAVAALRRAGFSHAALHETDSHLVRLVDARVT